VSPRHASPLALLLCASLALGCYSSSNVPSGGLGALRKGGEGAVVYAADGEAVRLDPNTNIRFVRTDGTTTPWYVARDLYVNDEGIFTMHDAPPEELHAATVTDLTPADIAAIRATIPEFASLRDVGEGAVLLHDGSKTLVEWMEAIQSKLGKVPGTWSFHLTPTMGPFIGDSVLRAMKNGVRVVDGLKWTSVVSSEVSNLNHSTTAVAVVGITALAVGIVAVATLSKGKISIPTPNLSIPAKAAGEAVKVAAHSTRAVARVASHTNVNIHVHSGSSGSGSGSGEQPSPPEITEVMTGDEDSPTMGAAELEPPDAKDARPLFGGAARRRSMVKIVASLDISRELSSMARTHGALTGTARMFNFIEIGGGLRMFGPVHGDLTPHTDAVPFFRLGIHAELDARGRYAFPFAIDVGAWNDVALFAKLDWGFRLRVTQQWSLGIYVLNPTYVRYKADRGPVGEPRWSFPSGLETSFVF